MITKKGYYGILKKVCKMLFIKSNMFTYIFHTAVQHERGPRKKDNPTKISTQFKNERSTPVICETDVSIKTTDLHNPRNHPRAIWDEQPPLHSSPLRCSVCHWQLSEQLTTTMSWVDSQLTSLTLPEDDKVIPAIVIMIFIAHGWSLLNSCMLGSFHVGQISYHSFVKLFVLL